jgi:hypothetical protein
MQHRIRQAISALAVALDIPQLGRITWADRESCRFTYFEVQRDRGILRNTVRRIAHQHDVVKARQHKLPATEVVIPKRGLEIISAIPAPLKRYTRVITGLEVRQQAREDSMRRRIWCTTAELVGKSKDLAEPIWRRLGDFESAFDESGPRRRRALRQKWATASRHSLFPTEAAT